MKIHLSIFVFCIGVLASSCHQKKDSASNTTVAHNATSESEKTYLIFEKQEYDFGTVDGNDKTKEFLRYDFVFTNDSERPIIIHKAEVSCGCISTKIPNEPILIGERGVIQVFADTKQLKGHFNKSIYVKSNAENDVALLRVKGSVKK